MRLLDLPLNITVNVIPNDQMTMQMTLTWGGWALRMPVQHAVLLREHCTGGFAALTSLPVLLPGTSACQTGYLSGSYLARTRSIALRLRASEWAVLFPFVA